MTSNGGPALPTSSRIVSPKPCDVDGLATTPEKVDKATSFSTPSSSASQLSYRLLYRGALSLPDSHLFLDGLTFIARFESPKKYHLLENPLALALESMRGRQSLRFVGTVNLNEIWLDESGNVELDIHPRAILSRIYFENVFCTIPFPCASGAKSSQSNTSKLGVKIALGDTDGPETMHIAVFAQAITPASSMISLKVARIMPHPPKSKPAPARLPRPDDPIPRRPPATFKRTLTMGDVLPRPTKDLKRGPSSSSSNILDSIATGGHAKRQKLSHRSNEPKLDKTNRSGNEESRPSTGDQVFKVPALPGKLKAKAKGKEKSNDYAFNTTPIGNGMIEDNSRGTGGKGLKEAEVEQANKDLIKKAVLEHLCRTKDPTLKRTVDRSHPEFKEIWGWIYRGVGFAVRAQMKIMPLDKQLVDSLIETHTQMYITGTGFSHVT